MFTRNIEAAIAELEWAETESVVPVDRKGQGGRESVQGARRHHNHPFARDSFANRASGERDSHKAVQIAVTPHRPIAAEVPLESSLSYLSEMLKLLYQWLLYQS